LSIFATGLGLGLGIGTGIGAGIGLGLGLGELFDGTTALLSGRAGFGL